MQKILRFLNSDFLILVPVVVFIILRFPSLFEPYWYGDEGIYQAIGVVLSNGGEMYTQAWDNKPPLLFILYALFQGSQFVARTTSLVFGVLTVAVFFKLSERIFSRKIVVASASIAFGVLFATPFLEGNIANTENFMLLLTVSGMFLVYCLLGEKKLPLRVFNDRRLAFFIAGLLFGLSFSMKVVGAFEYLCTLTLIVLATSALSKRLTNIVFLSLGFFLPISLFTIYFVFNGNLSPFLDSMLFSNFSYVDYQNRFLIPQGLLIFKAILLAGLITVARIYRKKISFEMMFILLWLGFSLFSSFLSQRSYTHYVLLSLAPLVLTGSYLLSRKRKNLIAVGMYAVLVAYLAFHFKPYPLQKSFLYYGNFLGYLTGTVDTNSYQRFFDKNVPRDYAVSEFVKMKLNPGDPLFVWGDSAQIYKLSETLPVGRFFAAYHINTEEKIEETNNAIILKKPRYIIILNDGEVTDLSLGDYEYLLSIEGAAVYEKQN